VLSFSFLLNCNFVKTTLNAKNFVIDVAIEPSSSLSV